MYILGDQKDDEIKSTAPEVTEAIMKVLENPDKETQRKLIRAIMRYRNFSGLDLEKAVKKKLELQKKVPEDWKAPGKSLRGQEKEK